MINNDLMVSVLVITYNQKDYIRTTIESILAQHTTFKYEILINDDCSTDGTTQIVLDYQKRYPDIIKVVTHGENQFDKVVSNFTEFLLPLVRGRYVAFCEGDDFWCEANKLQTQYEILQRHKNCRFCVHANLEYSDKFGRVIGASRPFDRDQVVPKDFLIENIHPFATNSYFVETSLYREYAGSELSRLSCHGDHKMSVYFNMMTETFYINKLMSVYRVMAKGSINSSIQKNVRNSKKYFEIQKNLLEMRSELLNYAKTHDMKEYACLYEKGIENLYFVYYNSIFLFGKAKKKCPNSWQAMNWRAKTSYYLKEFCPKFVYNAAKKHITYISI